MPLLRGWIEPGIQMVRRDAGMDKLSDLDNHFLDELFIADQQEAVTEFFEDGS